MRNLIFRNLGIRSYLSVLNSMKNFIMRRNFFSNDEIWFVQHYNIYTKGLSCKFKRNIKLIDYISVIYINRGGKTTFHAPGQLVIYVLFDLNRININLKKFIYFLEKIIISFLFYYSIKSHSCYFSPGIYISTKKICSIGLRLVNGNSLYGLSLNINMNLFYFSKIKPCGYYNLSLTQMNCYILNICINNLIFILIDKFLFFFFFFLII